MKALDTPVLLGLLHGSPSALKLVNSLEGEELATTEANMLELLAVAARGAHNLQRGRLRSLEKLRRRLTVLPIDSAAGALLASKASSWEPHDSPLVWGMMATLDSSGCAELITGPGPLPAGKWRFQVRRVKT